MATAVSGVGGVSQDQFLQLLIAQLQNQDPLDPVSNEEFISQLTSLNTLTGIQSLNASFSEMLKLQQLTQGVDLIGKSVTYTPAGGGPSVTGKVGSVNVAEGQIVLRVGTTDVSLAQVTAFTA
jgi:flagellar basal-body rod modification protein FlgD